MNLPLTIFALPAALAFAGTAVVEAAPAIGSQRSVQAESAPSHVDQAVRIALGSIDSAGADPVAVSRTISQLGAGAVNPLLDVLISGQFSEPVGEFGAMTRSVQRAHLGAMTRSIQRLPWASVRPIVQERYKPSTPLRSRLILCRLLAEVAPPADLSLLGVAVAGDGSPVPRDSHRTFGSALARWIHRDGEALAYFPQLVQAIHPSLLRTSIEILRAGAPDAALGAMGRSLGLNPSFDPILLMEIADHSKTASRPADPTTLAQVRPYISSINPNCALEAVSAVGRLDDVGSIEGLIEQMKSGSSAMQSRAKEGLEKLADERLGSDASAWANWFAAAIEWHRTVAPEVTRSLRSALVSERSRALLELARYRVFRHDLDESVIQCLGDSDEGVVVIACAVLGHYATASSTSALVDTLEAKSVQVRKAALDALHRATGKRPGELKSDWVAAGFGRSPDVAIAATQK